MTPEQLELIVRERLTEWTGALIALQATPFLLLGVGHGASEGGLYLIRLKPVSNQALTQMLRTVLLDLDREDSHGADRVDGGGGVAERGPALGDPVPGRTGEHGAPGDVVG